MHYSLQNSYNSHKQWIKKNIAFAKYSALRKGNLSLSGDHFIFNYCYKSGIFKEKHKTTIEAYGQEGNLGKCGTCNLPQTHQIYS